MGAQIGQPRVGREPVEDHRFRRAGEQGLAAVAEIAQSRGAVDGGAGVVAFVAQLDFAGVQADPQPDRRQWRALHFQRRGQRV